MTIADKAKEIVYGDREKTYGNPAKNLDMIADMWSAYTGADISATDVCNMMCMLKIARLKNNPGHEDSLVDLVGYALLNERTRIPSLDDIRQIFSREDCNQQHPPSNREMYDLKA